MPNYFRRGDEKTYTLSIEVSMDKKSGIFPSPLVGEGGTKRRMRGIKGN